MNCPHSHKKKKRSSKGRAWQFSKKKKTNYELSSAEGQHVQPDTTGFIFFIAHGTPAPSLMCLDLTKA